MYIFVLLLLLLSAVNSMFSDSLYTFKAYGYMKKSGVVLKEGNWLCTLRDLRAKVVEIWSNDAHRDPELVFVIYLRPKNTIKSCNYNSFSIELYQIGLYCDLIVFENVEMFDARVSLEALMKQWASQRLSFKAYVLRDGESYCRDAKSLCEVDSATMKMTIFPPHSPSVHIDLTNDITITDASASDRIIIDSVREIRSQFTGELSQERFTYVFEDVELNYSKYRSEQYADVDELVRTLMRWVHGKRKRKREIDGEDDTRCLRPHVDDAIPSKLQGNEDEDDDIRPLQFREHW